MASSEVEGREVVVVKDFGGPLGRKGRLGLKPVGLNPAKNKKLQLQFLGGFGFTLSSPLSGKDT